MCYTLAQAQLIYYALKISHFIIFKTESNKNRTAFVLLSLVHI